MPTVICPECLTRNPAGALTCRRCGASLEGGQDHVTVRSAPPEGAALAGRWMPEEKLSGDQTELWRGRDLQTGRAVLIRRLSAEGARDRARRSGFLREAELMRELEHRHIARVIDVVDDPTTPAVILSKQEGRTLEDVLERGRLPTAIALAWARQLLAALDHMHERGVVHGALTPARITVHISDGAGVPQLVIADLSTASSVDDDAQPASGRSGTLVGMRASDEHDAPQPASHVSPEALAREVSPRSDVYTLGALLFHMLTGRAPIAHGVESPTDVARAIHAEAPAPLRWVRPELSAQLEDVVTSALSKDPLPRPETSAAMSARLAATPEGRHPRMVFVPAGAFVRGCTEDDELARPEERPQRKLQLSPFYIDETPVTAAEFHAFVEATGHEVPEAWSDYNDPDARPNHPVVFVNWHDAAAYAAWAGKRLPTEAQWEKAARGDDGRRYPWGDADPTPEHAWYGDHRTPAPVGSRPEGDSPYGVKDMAGNVFEWVADWYSRTYYARAETTDPAGPDSGSRRVLRGGSFVHPAFTLRVTVRGRYQPDERRANHSFRCAWALE
jgi:serine/threonine-protein kinase